MEFVNKVSERLVLAVWLLRYFLVEGLRESTADIAPSLDPKSRIVVPPLLKEVYRVREIEEQLTRGDKHIGERFSTTKSLVFPLRRF